MTITKYVDVDLEVELEDIIEFVKEASPSALRKVLAECNKRLSGGATIDSLEEQLKWGFIQEKSRLMSLSEVERRLS